MPREKRPEPRVGWSATFLGGAALAAGLSLAPLQAQPAPAQPDAPSASAPATSPAPVAPEETPPPPPQPFVESPDAPLFPATDLTIPAKPADVSTVAPVPLSHPLPAESPDSAAAIDTPDPDFFAPLAPLAALEADTDLADDYEQPATGEIRYTLRIEGLDAVHMPALAAQFHAMSALENGKGKKGTAAQIVARTRADGEILKKILDAEGFYDSRVDTSMTPLHTDAGAAEETSILFRATPAERYLWKNITLAFLPPDLAPLRDRFLLKSGNPVRAIEVEAAEAKLLLDLQQSGYPFAKIGAHDIVLADDAPTADYTLEGETGPQGVFGAIHMHRFQPFDEKHAAVIARFAPGEPYDARMVDDLRRALIDTQLFGGVSVGTRDTGARDAEGRAVTDINIYGSKGPQKLLGGRLGYSTGEGARAEALWRHRNLIRPEGQFTARAVVGTIEQGLSGELAMSNWHQRDRTLRLIGEFANTRRPAYQARTITFGATLGRASTPIWQKPVIWSVGAEVIATDERDRSNPDSESRQTYFIVALPTMLGFDLSNDLLDPTRGARFTLWATPEFSRQGGATTTYGRIIAEATGYQGFGEKFVLAGRLRAGTILGADRAQIAPTRRLYAGGGGSVRGFDFQHVGPHDADNRPTGGRGLLEGSVEGRYRWGDMGVVGFIDAGTLTERPTPTLSDVHVGVGVGFRYYTDFGPIRIDVARAVTQTEHAPKLGLYISIGQAF